MTLLALLACVDPGNKPPDDTGAHADPDPCPVAVVDPTTLDFYGLELSVPSEQTVSVLNNCTGSTTSLTLQASVDGAAFDVDPTLASLAPGEIGTFTISATVTDYAEVSGSLALVTSDPARPLVTVSLTASADADQDGDGYAVDTDCDDADASVSPAAAETWYDGIDQDCDGNDNDQDGDGYAVDSDCDDADASVSPAAEEAGYDGIDQDCDGNDDDQDGDGAAFDLDCDDTDATAYPGAEETWYDGIDQDCDGNDDDQDGDGTPLDLDCDDLDPAISPGATELCDAANVDENCDGVGDDATADASTMTTFYADDDADGYGDPAAPLLACDLPAGASSSATDCDDGDASVNPAGAEVCDALNTDEDCDGLADNDDLSTDRSAFVVFYADDDADGYGEVTNTAFACDAPIGFISDDTDCDDARADVNPGETELCDDGLDNDCDGTSNACALSGTIGLSAATADAKIRGQAASDWLSYHAMSAGDLDGDGRSDIVLGSLFYDGVGENSGRAYVFYGPVSGTMSAGSADVRVDGASSGDVLGNAVLAGFDLSGDGRDDLVVGASARGADDAGAVYAFTGGLATNESASGADSTWSGTTASAQFGYRLDGGDVDGDGSDDLAVGTFSGGLYLFTGPISTGAQSLASAHAQYTGGGVGGVTAIGDVDGDGVDDVATGGPTPSVVYVVTSDPGGTVAIATAADATYTGESTWDGAGQSIAIGGDADGDGYGDLVIGASGEDSAGVEAGAAYVVYGPTTGANLLSVADIKLTGESADDYCGATVGWVGDVDNDGHDDLLVGCHHEDSAGTDAGAAYLFYGLLPPSGSVASADAKFQGESAADYASLTLAAAGDTDGDGFSDFLIGSYADDDGGTEAGAAYLIRGGGL